MQKRRAQLKISRPCLSMGRSIISEFIFFHTATTSTTMLENLKVTSKNLCTILACLTEVTNCMLKVLRKSIKALFTPIQTFVKIMVNDIPVLKLGRNKTKK